MLTSSPVASSPCGTLHPDERPRRRRAFGAYQAGEGVWLEDFEGNRFIDAVSSWWVNLFGHANPRINAAIQKQIGELEHVILAGFTHEPVVNLSERLIEVTPPGLNKVFTPTTAPRPSKLP